MSVQFESHPVITQALLLCAGLGTRMRPFSDELPKGLLPLFGIPFMQLALDAWQKAGVKVVVVNYHRQEMAFRRAASRLDLGGMQLRLSDESAWLRGVAGAMVQAWENGLLAPEPFLIANSDMLVHGDWSNLIAHHQKLRARRGVQMTLGLGVRRPALEPLALSNDDTANRPSGNNGLSLEDQEAYREIEFDPETYLLRGVGLGAPGTTFYLGTSVVEPSVVKQLLRDTPLKARSGPGPLDFSSAILHPLLEKRQVGVFLWPRSRHLPLFSDGGSPHLWYSAHRRLLTTEPQLWTHRVSEMSREPESLERLQFYQGGSYLQRFGSTSAWSKDRLPHAEIRGSGIGLGSYWYDAETEQILNL